MTTAPSPPGDQAEDSAPANQPSHRTEPVCIGIDVVVAPIQGGAGIKVKVMDAAARGLPIVTTSSGVEGFGSSLPTGVRVADTAEAFAREVCSLLTARPVVPIRENIVWYDDLVRAGAAAIQKAIGSSA